MAEFLSVEVQGNEALLADLVAAVKRMQEPRELLEALGARLVTNIERRFDTKTDPSEQRWETWAASTGELYDRQDTQKKGPRAGQVVRRGTLLERTGQMRNSLTYAAGDDQVLVGMNRLTDGGKWAIPLLHEFGTTRMPRRGIFFADPEAGTLGAEDEADLDAELKGFLDKIFGA